MGANSLPRKTRFATRRFGRTRGQDINDNRARRTRRRPQHDRVEVAVDARSARDPSTMAGVELRGTRREVRLGRLQLEEGGGSVGGPSTDMSNVAARFRNPVAAPATCLMQLASPPSLAHTSDDLKRCSPMFTADGLLPAVLRTRTESGPRRRCPAGRSRRDRHDGRRWSFPGCGRTRSRVARPTSCATFSALGLPGELRVDKTIR